jgi:3-oxoacyl-[acyl-carrier protein] reductase
MRGVLITGASRGIGAACARAFAARGERVAIHYGSAESRAREVLASLDGSGHTLAPADLRDPDAVAAMVGRAAAELGRLDVVVNNAGIFDPAHPITDTTYEQWRAAWADTIAVNLTGPANVTHRAVPHLIAAGGGHIVNVASRGAFRGEPDHPAYGATKAGLVALGQSLARALGRHNISVTSVAPGFVETDMAAPHLEGEAGEARRAETALGRIAQPEDVAAAVVYLASPEATMASGSVLDVNGASFLRM